MQSTEFYQNVVHKTVVNMVNQLVTRIKEYKRELSQDSNWRAAITMAQIHELRQNLSEIGIKTTLMFTLVEHQPWYEDYQEVTFEALNDDMKIILDELMETGAINTVNGFITYKFNKEE